MEEKKKQKGKGQKKGKHKTERQKYGQWKRIPVLKKLTY